MLKTYLFIFLVMLTGPVLSASLMSHEKFVHLSYQEQKQIVIATMELVVELEAKYKHEVKTSGFDPERYRRYTEFVKKVSSLIFPEAHAGPVKNQRYGQYLNELTTILNQRNRCIYGGWISEMRGNLCTHPLYTQFRNLYQTESGCTGGSNQITCNPAIFGFKNVNSKTLFCVPAGLNEADNTSRDCMAKALANPPEAGVSTREQRIANMIEGIGRNPNDSNAVFDFLIKACACDASRSPQISQHYSNYMRPHQTCYSILKMMSEVSPSCQVNNQPLMDANQTQFLTAIRGILSETEMRSNDVRTLYNTKLADLRANNAEFRASEAAICGGSPVTPVIPTTSCEDSKKLSNGTCCESGQIPNENRASCIADPNDGDDGTIVVGTTGNTSGGGVTGNTSGGGVTGNTSGGGVTGNTSGGGVTGNTSGGIQGGGTETCANGASNHPTCTTCPTGKQMNADSTQCVNSPTATECTPPVEGKELIGGQCRDTCNEETEERDTATFECRCKHGDRPEGENTQCPAASEEGDDAQSDISISLSGSNKDNNTTTITVRITPESTDKENYTILWFSRGRSRPRTIPNTTPRTADTENIVSEDLPERNASGDDDAVVQADPARIDPNATGSDETALTRADDWQPFDLPRQSSDYEICARLIRNRAKIAEDCEKVPMKPAIAPRRNSSGNPFLQPQMGPTRGGPSDAIFRGIR